ncbi:MAG: Gfo/Idh/MocA family oxidoreductase [Usitatibacter sp.]
MAPLRLGVAGLGRAFTLMLPTLAAHGGVKLAAAADPRREARERFASQFGARAYETVEALCGDSSVDAVYVATPHQHHAAHAILAARSGKHVLVEKPMALTIGEADAMIAAAREAGVRLVVGHSHSFDAPILRAREIVESGELGAVRMITSLQFTDFLYRARRPEELDTGAGGGVLFSQAAHQVDVARLLGGGLAASVRTMAGAWDASRPTEGAYAALIAFEGGAFASLAYSGYGHFDSDELCGWIGESGARKDPSAYGAARRALAQLRDPDEEADAKAARNYGGAREAKAGDGPAWHEHFGLVVVSCERGDIRPMPGEVIVYGDTARRVEPLERPAVPRAEVIDELCAAAAGTAEPLHGGEWGLATLEVCIAMLRSARESRDVALARQVAPRGIIRR